MIIGKQLFPVIKQQIGEPKLGCEVGIWKGQTSRILLNRFTNLVLLMVDKYECYETGGRGAVGIQAKSQHLMHQAMVTMMEGSTFVADRRRILIMDSVSASTLIADGSLDFVFIDADHSYESIKGDLEAWCPKVRSGGLVSGHDYSLQRWGVKKAVDEFVHNSNYDLQLSSCQIWHFLK